MSIGGTFREYYKVASMANYYEQVCELQALIFPHSRIGICYVQGCDMGFWWFRCGLGVLP
jgi:hypothetical protein